MKVSGVGMDLKQITDFIGRLVDEPGGNYVSEEAAISPELASLKMYGSFELGIASSNDACFESFKAPEVIGPAFMPPREWLPEARSVISVFFHVTRRVAESNAADPAWPSAEWLHARHEGQAFISSAMKALKGELEKNGCAATVPAIDPRFFSESFTSNWSERHAAYVCGLGTFGLSKGFITRSGMAGRFGSVITELELPPTARGYSGVYDWCIMCGACAMNCPNDAISVESGKNHEICSNYLNLTEKKFYPRYGCGKCQVSVPCENASPGLAEG
ncbi:MAG: 4Fe-4S binding protein [Synergistaceae bacterium]|jgi:epoxyqueuosine reductase QueG|nr:4Fe-4S binding protein [Synergistaceae bacterium]